MPFAVEVFGAICDLVVRGKVEGALVVFKCLGVNCYSFKCFTSCFRNYLIEETLERQEGFEHI